MKVFVWQSVDHATNRYHSSGGVVIFAETEARARELANANAGCSIQDDEMPDAVHDVACDYERVFIMPDAGCC